MMIIALVAALFVANYHSSTSQADLNMSAQKLVADVHAAQSNSLGLTNYNNALPPGGWGVHFDVSYGYTIYAELHAPGDANFMNYSSSSEAVEAYGARRVTLPKNIKIDRLTGVSHIFNDSQADVNFLPPDPQTNIRLRNSSSTVLNIDLKNIANGQCRTVQINFLGLAEVLEGGTCR